LNTELALVVNIWAYFLADIGASGRLMVKKLPDDRKAFSYCSRACRSSCWPSFQFTLTRILFSCSSCGV